MDASLNRRWMEIDGYCELGLWEEAQELVAELVSLVAEKPEALAFLARLGVAIEFDGSGASREIPRFFTPTLAHARTAWGRAELASF